MALPAMPFEISNPMKDARQQVRGRNEPCGCGSGRKYKACCLRTTELWSQRGARLRADEAALVPALLAFAAEFYGEPLLQEAWAVFFAGEAPRPTVNHPLFETLFVPWFVFDFIPDPTARRKRGQRFPPSTVAQTYLDLFPQKLTATQGEFLRAAARTTVSFHLVTGVRAGESLEIEDLLVDRKYRVYERTASNMVKEGGVLLARVVAVADAAIMIGCAPLVLPPLWRIEVGKLRAHLEGGEGALSNDEVREAGADLLAFFHRAADQILNPKPPKLVNTDGEPIAPSTLRFSIRCTPREAFDRLASLSLWRGEDAMEEPGFDRSGTLRQVGLTWSKRGNRMHKEWDNTSLGRIAINGNVLTARVNSRRRAGRIRRQIEKRLGDDVSFVREALDPIERVMREAHESARAGKSGRPKEATPPELEQAVREMMAAHWAQWLDDRIPALGNMTPRRAATSAEGRIRLEALLAEYSWNNERQPAHLRIDVNGLRRQLGLQTR
jgi:hypothetical protein